MNKIEPKNRFLNRIESFPIIVVYIVLLLIFLTTATRVFTGYRIYMSFFQTIPPQLVLALGLTMVITAGEIDLSFPAVVAFSGFLFSFIYRTLDAPLLGLIIALAGGGLVGYINGVVIARIGVPSIMATLAAQFFWNGFTTLISQGLSWNIITIRGRFLHSLFVGRIGGVLPAQSIWAFGLAVFLWFILNRHKFGEAIMFIGDNEQVARVVGINVESTKIKLFTIHGIISAFGGVLLTLEMVNFWSTQGGGFLLPVMAAVFIGGTSIAGGYGTIVGTFFGAYIIGSLEAGVVATGMGGYWVRLVSGLVMAFSMILNIIIREGTMREKMKKIKERQSVSRTVNRKRGPK